MSLRRIVTHYKIVTASSVTGLEVKVREEIAKGWQPVGGVMIVPELWVQAMVWKRYEAPPSA